MPAPLSAVPPVSVPRRDIYVVLCPLSTRFPVDPLGEVILAAWREWVVAGTAGRGGGTALDTTLDTSDRHPMNSAATRC